MSFFKKYFPMYDVSFFKVMLPFMNFDQLDHTWEAVSFHGDDPTKSWEWSVEQIQHTTRKS